MNLYLASLNAFSHLVKPYCRNERWATCNSRTIKKAQSWEQGWSFQQGGTAYHITIKYLQHFYNKRESSDVLQNLISLLFFKQHNRDYIIVFFLCIWSHLIILLTLSVQRSTIVLYTLTFNTYLLLDWLNELTE